MWEMSDSGINFNKLSMGCILEIKLMLEDILAGLWIVGIIL